MSKRIYVVSPLPAITIDKQPQHARLVRAATPAQAVRHVTTGLFDVNVASQEDLVRLLSDGIKLEQTAAEE